MGCDAEFSHDVTLATSGNVTNKASKTKELCLELYFCANEFFGFSYSKPVSLPVIGVKYSCDSRKEDFLQF